MGRPRGVWLWGAACALGLTACGTTPSAAPVEPAAPPSQPSSTPAPVSTSPEPVVDPTLACVAVLPEDVRIGQTMLVTTTDVTRVQGWLDDGLIAGILSNGRLTPALAAALDAATTGNQYGALLAADEEGGEVQRYTGVIGPIPSARRQANTMTPDEVRSMYAEHGASLADWGVDLVFAPVVDVGYGPGIGSRSYSDDPQVVTEYGQAAAQGYAEAGLLPVLKHFPGHGHGSGDSHVGGVTTPPLADLQANDLVPYRTLTTAAPVAVMVGHLQVPGLTGDQPASLTPSVYGLLRSGEYGGPPFGGPVFTDDLSSMRAISDRFGVAEAALRALQAGADVALWVTTGEVPAVLDRLESAVNSGELNMGQVDGSVLRVAGFKGQSPNCGR